MHFVLIEWSLALEVYLCKKGEIASFYVFEVGAGLGWVGVILTIPTD
jgi:hypothetical protein